VTRGASGDGGGADVPPDRRWGPGVTAARDRAPTGTVRPAPLAVLGALVRLDAFGAFGAVEPFGVFGAEDRSGVAGGGGGVAEGVGVPGAKAAGVGVAAAAARVPRSVSARATTGPHATIAMAAHSAAAALAAV
jgi:hypothetical protein